MAFHFINLKRLLFLAGAAAAVSFAQAQTLTSPGQAIVFSTPDDGDAAANTPSVTAQPPVAPGFSDMIHAPEFNLQSPSTANANKLPAPTTVEISPAEADRRANWALMTPAEILGVATPEQILKIPERDAAGRRKNPTVMERYYDRQDQAQTNGAGGFLAATPPLRGDFSDNEDTRLNANVFNQAGGGFGNPAQQANAFQQPAPGNGADAGQNGGADWSKIFISTPTSGQSPAQAADMAEFRKLLDPDQPSKSSRPSSDSGIFSSPKATPGSALGQPANSAGGPFGAFNNGIGGLPGVAGQASVPTVATVPDWKPQPPPWMIQGPQPGEVPKRKF